MEWKQVPLGTMQTNCYVLKKEDKSCLIIDPGSEGEKLIQYLQSEDLKPVAVVLTHAHYDHIGAIDTIREEYHIPVYLHENEKDWLSSPALNLGNVSVKEADELITGEQELTIGSFTFQIYETPGHSPGSISLYFKEDDIVCSGDVLFKRSIGRSDLPNCNPEHLMKSIHDKLLPLPENTTVLCGHGSVTTIGDELESNPFLNGF